MEIEPELQPVLGFRSGRHQNWLDVESEAEPSDVLTEIPAEVCVFDVELAIKCSIWIEEQPTRESRDVPVVGREVPAKVEPQGAVRGVGQGPHDRPQPVNDQLLVSLGRADWHELELIWED